MKVRVLFFGATADLVGSRETSVNVKGNPNVRAALESILKDHPALHRQKLLFSVNEEYASADTLIKDGDELAIFTPVSGG